MSSYRASCHCGAIELRLTGPIDEVLECNCSICTKKGFVHWIVAPERFELIRGAEVTSCYQFGTKSAHHYFCSVCGITPYYVPRSHPDKLSVNLRCVDGVDLETIERRRFDGKNWERSRASLDRGD